MDDTKFTGPGCSWLEVAPASQLQVKSGLEGAVESGYLGLRKLPSHWKTAESASVKEVRAAVIRDHLPANSSRAAPCRYDQAVAMRKP